MQDLIKDLIGQLQDLVTNNNMFISLFFGFFIIILESILPILPLALFIALNTVNIP